MSIDCGSQIVLCDLPIRFDTYKGCYHNCKYCFVKRKKGIDKVEPDNCVESLKNFIKGKRTLVTNWCDWDIPIHWGGVSDPFQPAEEQYKISYNALKVFAKTKYPFIVSTKGKILCKPEYIELLKQCNAVVQISMVCDKYDKLETGAPSYNERLEMCKKIVPNCKRLIVRIQPYFTDVFDDVVSNIPKLKEAGVYAITIEGMKFFKPKKELTKLGADYVYRKETLKRHFEKIKEVCHENGLKFYCAENRLRTMGDAYCCCGIDGLEGFNANNFNLCHIINGDKVKPTQKMKQPNTAGCFKTLNQDCGTHQWLQQLSLCDLMLRNAEKYKPIFK